MGVPVSTSGLLVLSSNEDHASICRDASAVRSNMGSASAASETPKIDRVPYAGTTFHPLVRLHAAKG